VHKKPVFARKALNFQRLLQNKRKMEIKGSKGVKSTFDPYKFIPYLPYLLLIFLSSFLSLDTLRMILLTVLHALIFKSPPILFKRTQYGETYYILPLLGQ